MNWTMTAPTDTGWFWFRAAKVYPTMARLFFVAGDSETGVRGAGASYLWAEIAQLQFKGKATAVAAQFPSAEWSDERVMPPPYCRAAGIP